MIKHRALLLLAMLLWLLPNRAFAACTSPNGNEGDMWYTSISHQMVYCNGTNWVTMGSTNYSGPSFGTLTTNDFCTATSGTAITCTTSSTGTGNVVLSASPTLTGTVTAGTFSGSGASLTGIGTASLGGITGTPSSTTYLRGDGTWATVSSGGFSSCTRVTNTGATPTITVSCSAGYTMTGGGCDSGSISTNINKSYPSAAATWTCTTNGSTTAYAICCH